MKSWLTLLLAVAWTTRSAFAQPPAQNGTVPGGGPGDGGPPPGGDNLTVPMLTEGINGSMPVGGPGGDVGNPFPGEGGGDGDMNMTDAIVLNGTDAGGGMQPPPEMGGGDMPGGNGTDGMQPPPPGGGGGNVTEGMPGDGMPGDGGNIFNNGGGGDGNETSTEMSSNITMTGSDNTTDAGTDMGTEAPTASPTEDTGGGTLSIPTGSTTGNDTAAGEKSSAVGRSSLLGLALTATAYLFASVFV